MNTHYFLLSLLLAFAVPVIVVSYLRPILMRVLHTLCDADGSAEFWIRCAYVLTISGTLLMTLMFGGFDAGIEPLSMLRRTLVIVMGGVFLSIGIISRRVWFQVRELQHAQRQATMLAQVVSSQGVSS